MADGRTPAPAFARQRLTAAFVPHPRDSLDFDILRILVAALAPQSSLFVARNVWAATTPAERAVLHDEYRREFGGHKPVDVLQRPGRENAAPKLHAAIERARRQHAVDLRDAGFRDIEITWHGEEGDRNGPTRLLIETRTQFAALGFKPYYQQAYNQSSCTMGLGIVVPMTAIDLILPEQRCVADRVIVAENTEPAAADADMPKEQSPDCEQTDAVGTPDAVVITPSRPRLLSVQSSPDIADHDGPPTRPRPWFTYSSAGRCHLTWTPQAAEHFDSGDPDPEGLAWIGRDLRLRIAQLDEYAAARRAHDARNALYGRARSHDFPRVDGLCDVYPSNQSHNWHGREVLPAAQRDFARSRETFAQRMHVVNNTRARVQQLEKLAREHPSEPKITTTLKMWNDRLRLAQIEARHAETLMQQAREDVQAAMGRDLHAEAPAPAPMPTARPVPPTRAKTAPVMPQPSMPIPIPSRAKEPSRAEFMPARSLPPVAGPSRRPQGKPSDIDHILSGNEQLPRASPPPVVTRANIAGVISQPSSPPPASQPRQSSPAAKQVISRPPATSDAVVPQRSIRFEIPLPPLPSSPSDDQVSASVDSTSSAPALTVCPTPTSALPAPTAPPTCATTIPDGAKGDGGKGSLQIARIAIVPNTPVPAAVGRPGFLSVWVAALRARNGQPRRQA